MTRKIERQMVTVMTRLMRAKQVSSVKVGSNTRVDSDATGAVWVYLHGHNIAFMQDNASRYELKLNLCGWNTPTTRSRLSAICRDFVPRCNGISTKQGQARIAYRDGETGLRFVDIDSNGWFTV